MPWTKLVGFKRSLTTISRAFLFLFATALAVAAVVVIWAFELKLTKFPVYIYSSPVRISVGDDIDNVEMTERLTRLGYTRTSKGNVGLGEWRLSDWSLTINFRKPPVSGYRLIQGPVNMNLESGRIKDIRLMRSQQQASEIIFEPEILHIIAARGYGQELCRFVPLKEIPQLLVDAIVLTEDSNFMSHHGIDWSSVLTAIKSNIEAGRYVQGASTITQQLIKMTLLSNEKTLWRKINEIVLSIVADAIYSKKTILESYLNRVYFGQLGAYPINGVYEAASELLGKSLDELDASDCALLAATIRGPNVINPFRHPERATGRRNIVLGILLKNGKISREAYDEALEKPVSMQKPGASPVRAPGLMDLVSSTDSMTQATMEKTNRFVVTTIDPILQLRMDSGLRKLVEPSVSLQAMLLNPENGSIMALHAQAGMYKKSFQGSLDLFSPFVMIPAFSTEKKSAPKYALTSQIFLKDSDNESFTVLQSFRNDRPSLISRIIRSVGADRVSEVLREAGVDSELKSTGEILIGPVDIQKLASIYSLAANVGDFSEPSIVYKTGNLETPDSRARRRPALSASAIYLVNHMLKNTSQTDEGDNMALNLNKIPSRLISTDPEGTWGIVYNSNALMVIRLNAVLRDTGRISAFTDYVMAPLISRTATAHAPSGILFRRICSESGLRATSMCSKISVEPFISGTQPHEWCPIRHELDTRKPLKGKIQ